MIVSTIPGPTAAAEYYFTYIRQVPAGDIRATLEAHALALFRDLPVEAWTRRGVASGQEVTVHALAYITAGHLAHHMRILRERYLP